MSSLSRKTPLRRKRPTPRRVKASCNVRGCKRPPTSAGMCTTHAKRKADELWGGLIRTGKCEVQDFPHQCGGPNQACHGFSRGYLGTRYLLENGFSGCAAANFLAEVKPLEWDSYLRSRWGPRQYEKLRALALNFGKQGEHLDYGAVINGLRKDQ